METIIAYVENVFRTLPDTDELARTKEEILNNMLDKYNELKQNGRSEHEAVGIVISEFGNIDELLEEMNLVAPKSTSNKEADTDSSRRHMSLSEVKDYIGDYTKAGKAIALGVVLCIVGVALLILLGEASEDGFFLSNLLVHTDNVLGLILLFVFVAGGVALFIIHGMRLSKYSYVQNGVHLDEETKEYVTTRKADVQPSFTGHLVTGIIVCALSPLIVIVGGTLESASSSYSVTLFLLVVAVGVYILVSAGVGFGCMTTLLSDVNQTAKEKKSDFLTGTFCGVIMLLATAIYLFSGFVWGKWETAPVIFAIGGILCGICAIIINAVVADKSM